MAIPFLGTGPKSPIVWRGVSTAHLHAGRAYAEDAEAAAWKAHALYEKQVRASGNLSILIFVL